MILGHGRTTPHVLRPSQAQLCALLLGAAALAGSPGFFGADAGSVLTECGGPEGLPGIAMSYIHSMDTIPRSRAAEQIGVTMLKELLGLDYDIVGGTCDLKLATAEVPRLGAALSQAWATIEIKSALFAATRPATRHDTKWRGHVRVHFSDAQRKALATGSIKWILLVVFCGGAAALHFVLLPGAVFTDWKGSLARRSADEGTTGIHTGEDEEFDEDDEFDYSRELRRLSVEQLREECLSRNLPDDGQKPALVSRLLAASAPVTQSGGWQRIRPMYNFVGRSLVKSSFVRGEPAEGAEGQEEEGAKREGEREVGYLKHTQVVNRETVRAIMARTAALGGDLSRRAELDFADAA